MSTSLLVALIGAIAVVLAALIKLIGEVIKVTGNLISVWLAHRLPGQDSDNAN